MAWHYCKAFVLLHGMQIRLTACVICLCFRWYANQKYLALTFATYITRGGKVQKEKGSKTVSKKLPSRFYAKTYCNMYTVI